MEQRSLTGGFYTRPNSRLVMDQDRTERRRKQKHFKPSQAPITTNQESRFQVGPSTKANCGTALVHTDDDYGDSGKLYVCLTLRHFASYYD